jgi:hypothetical protein
MFGVGTGVTILNPMLYCQMRNHSTGTAEETVSANFSSGLLSELIPTWDYEALVVTELTAAGGCHAQ